MNYLKNKLVVIGAGMVGSAVLNNALSLNLLAEVVVIDSNVKKALGEALDASHTTSFAYTPNINVRIGDYEDCKDAQIIVITAGPSIKPGEKSDRLLLAETNVKVIKEVMDNITKYTKDAVIIIVTNPVDVVTYYCQQHFNYPKNKIIGAGTLLDSARLRRIIAQRFKVDTKNVHGYILGEHGKNSFAAWSHVNIAGIPFEDLDEALGTSNLLNQEEILEEVKDSGFEVLRLKGYTNSGIAASVSRLVRAILLNEQSILPVSSTLEGEFGISNVALSIPCIITRNGIEKRLQVPLTEEEINKLRESAGNLATVLERLKIRI